MRLDPLDHDRRAHSGDVGRNVLLLAVGEQPLLDPRGRLGAEAACDLVCLRNRGKLDSRGAVPCDALDRKTTRRGAVA
jgi:hypothetical protein